jgi:hypothetical protein
MGPATQVESACLISVTSKIRRTKDVMTVLDDVLATDVRNRGDLSAYMEPSTNNAINPAFLLLDIWS